MKTTKYAALIALFMLSMRCLAANPESVPGLFKSPVKTSSLIENLKTGNKGRISAIQDQILDSYQNQTEAMTNLLRNMTVVTPDDDLRKTTVIFLLGEMRASKSVEVLADNLMFVPKEDYFEFRYKAPQENYPAAVALVSIGNPSIDAMVKRIANSSSKDERELAAWVLMQIDGPELSPMRLQSVMNQSNGEAERNFGKAIDYMKQFKPIAANPKAKP